MQGQRYELSDYSVLADICSSCSEALWVSSRGSKVSQVSREYKTLELME
jgi:hypothetical protein